MNFRELPVPLLILCHGMYCASLAANKGNTIDNLNEDVCTPTFYHQDGVWYRARLVGMQDAVSVETIHEDRFWNPMSDSARRYWSSLDGQLFCSYEIAQHVTEAGFI